MERSVTDLTANSLKTIMDIAPVVSVLVLIIFVLIWFIYLLLKDAREERALNRDVVKGNTAILAELKEMIRGAINR